MADNTMSIPASPSSADDKGKSSEYKPYEVNPDLASSHMAEVMMERMPAPAIVSKEFVIWQGIFKGLQHTEQNKTYYDCQALSTILDCVSYNSVNIQGALFEKFWQFMMKPKMVVQGIPGQTTFGEEEKTSLWDRTVGKWLGGGEKKNGTEPK